MTKIALLFGTRPEAIKLAPLVLLLKSRDDLVCRVCITGQHRQMLDQVLEVFGIVPDADLGLMQPNQTLAKLTSRAIEALDGYLAVERPDLVLVQGDTTTVLSATLAAFYQRIPVGHVEAGLRTRNLDAPWPEEANRVLTSRIAALHFTPTANDRKNLLDEGVPVERTLVTGNTVIDALMLTLQKVRAEAPAIEGLDESLMASPDAPRMVLITCHRRESFGAGFESICRAISLLAQRFPEVAFVYPVHLNPNVREPVQRILSHDRQANVHLIEPQPYKEFVRLMDRCCLILTDSGGVQEEAPTLGKPVLVLRNTTERRDALAAGAVMLVGTDQERMVAEASHILSRSDSVRSESPSSPYGDGRASQRIASGCLNFLAKRPVGHGVAEFAPGVIRRTSMPVVAPSPSSLV